MPEHCLHNSKSLACITLITESVFQTYKSPYGCMKLSAQIRALPFSMGGWGVREEKIERGDTQVRGPATLLSPGIKRECVYALEGCSGSCANVLCGLDVAASAVLQKYTWTKPLSLSIRSI